MSEEDKTLKRLIDEARNPLIKIDRLLKEQDAEPIKHDMPPRPQSNRSKTLEGHKGFKRLKQKDVLERFYSIHGNRYTYSYVKYKNQITPIRVFCSEHGDFLITPSAHWKGVGCPECKKKSRNLKKKTN